MAHKFYFGDKLIRTSKDHIYTHAAININTGKCYGCSSTLKGAQANIDRMLSGHRTGIENTKNAIAALARGQKGYWYKDGRRGWYHRFEKDDTLEAYDKWIKYHEDTIDWITKNLRVVELEER